MLGARSNRAQRRRELLRLLIQRAKKKLKAYRRRRSALTEEQKIDAFIKWCARVGLDLHPKVELLTTTSLTRCLPDILYRLELVAMAHVQR